VRLLGMARPLLRIVDGIEDDDHGGVTFQGDTYAYGRCVARHPSGA
jgi:hypothetical protein